MKVQYPIRLSVDVQTATDKPYVRPNETVTFTMTTEADEAVTFYVDFNDGVKLVTSHGVVSHSWQREDAYRVNITAVTRVATEQLEKTVKIEWVEEGVAPELVVVQGNRLPESRRVRFYMTAVGVYAKTCELDLGDETKKEFGKKEMMIYEGEQDHTYATIGFYDIRLRCQNDYGITEDTSQVLASHPVLEYESLARHTDVRIPVVGADVNTIVAKVNGERTNFMSDASGVTIAGAEFSYSGEYVVRLEAAGGQALVTKVYNLQEVIGELSIVPTPRETRVNSSIFLEFAIAAGDHVHVEVDYGDGSVEYVYFGNESIPLMFSRSHAYDELGTYYVVITAANDVSFRSHREIVSIERDIEYATMTASGVIKLNEPVLFTFEVDMDKTPAMPIEVELEYDSLTNETVQLGSKRAVATPLEYRYVFEEYGKYLVLALVRNNISVVTAEARVQVGQDIVSIDMQVDKDHVQTNEELVYTLDVPRGSPLKVELDTGDGDTVTVDEYGNLEPTVTTTTVAAAAAVTVEIVDGEAATRAIIEAVTEADMAGIRRKRDVDAASFNGTDSPAETTVVLEATVPEVNPTVADEEDMSTIANDIPDGGIQDALPPDVKEPAVVAAPAAPETGVSDKSADPTTPPPNKKIIVRYKYRTPGHYNIKVKVSNKYTTHVSHLCQQIVVVAERPTKPRCDTLSMSLTGQYR